VPLFVTVILGAGLVKRVAIFDEFTTGAGDGLRTCVRVLPSLVALMTAVEMLQASGITEQIASLLSSPAAAIGFPPEALPLAFLRPISGSGSLAALKQVLSHYGPDSHAGLVACVLQCSTETTFYTMAVYYGAVRVRHTRHTLAAASIGDISGLIFAAFTVRILLL
jgi:spore maturation protein B